MRWGFLGGKDFKYVFCVMTVCTLTGAYHLSTHVYSEDVSSRILQTTGNQLTDYMMS
jgi:hypothetical protein